MALKALLFSMSEARWHRVRDVVVCGVVVEARARMSLLEMVFSVISIRCFDCWPCGNG